MKYKYTEDDYYKETDSIVKKIYKYEKALKGMRNEYNSLSDHDTEMAKKLNNDIFIIEYTIYDLEQELEQISIMELIWD